jgi:hypothetical protein
MKKSRRTVPVTYRNMPLKKSAYQKDVEVMRAEQSERLTITLLTLGLFFLAVWVLGF